MTDIFQWWLDDEKGGGHENWKRVREGLVNHDPSCSSLHYAWLPREGGVSCPYDLFWCSDCGVGFFNEGGFEFDDNDYLCSCCYRKRW